MPVTTNDPNSNKGIFSYKPPSPINGYDTTTPFSPTPYHLNEHSYLEKEREIVAWVNRMYREGLTSLSAEPAWRWIQRSIDYIYRVRDLEVSSLTSQLQIPQVDRDIEEIVATYSNFRPIADYQGPHELAYTYPALNDIYT